MLDRPILKPPEAGVHPPPPGYRILHAEAEGLARLVAAAHGVALHHMAAPGRGPAVVARARHIAIYLAHVHLGLAPPQATALVHRDRTLLAYACRRIEDSRDDPVIDRRLDALAVAADALAGVLAALAACDLAPHLTVACCPETP
ncbi:hypothetical protein [Methylobrevis pamukkalensis]|uniref:Chromosomal replication initiator DnaA C-terminal domain-containing protein n=1 Tax=Methylobrevis pamukkalensis TaxID=1439726 RepID=A0A1E3HAA9_9HYPH|nr:hypothetical protein [Methylobrevis pamukkalensis]ODN72411.1 hypothetical protein A6302_00157 [Methylobrevis pamukkalensis]